MISLTTLSKNLETKLNTDASNLGGVQFYVVPGTGKYKKPKRQENTVTEYVNCELRSLSSDVSNLNNGLLFATQSCNLSILLKLEDEEENISDLGVVTIGNKTKIANFYTYLNSIFSNTTTESITENNKTYTVSTIYQFLNDGEREIRQGIGLSYTFNVSIYYMYVENGINSKNVIYYLDGIIIPYQLGTLNRSDTNEGYIFANTTDGSAKNLAAMTSFYVSFEIPAISNSVCDKFLDYLLGDEKINTAHILTIQINNKEKSYLVKLGEAQATADTVKNVGEHITFVEIAQVYDLVSINENIYSVASSSISQFIKIGAGKVAFNFNTKIFATNLQNESTNVNLKTNSEDYYMVSK